MKDKKKILFFSDFNFFAGCENMISVLINNKKIQTEFYLHLMARDINWYIQKKENKYVKFTKIKKKINFFNKFNNGKLKILATEFMNFISICLQLFKLFKKEKFDIIHINSGGYLPNSGTFAILFMTTFLKSDVLLVVNNLPQTLGIKKYFKFLINYLVKLNVKIIISGSKYANRSIKDFIGITSDKLINIRNAINCCERKNKTAKRLIKYNDAFIFGSSGHLEKRKGHILLLNAFYNVLRKNKKFKKLILLIEGKNVDQKDILDDFIKRKNLSNKIIFLGRIDNICDFYETIDCLVMPSLEGEDLPNTIGESLRHGKPVISSNFAGMHEMIIENHNGFVFDSGDIKDLECKMEKILLEENQNFFFKKSKYTYDKYLKESIIVNQYIDIYNSL